MKRYLLFGGPYNYPAGGWDDYLGAFYTSAEAEREFNAVHWGAGSDWGHVVDSRTRKIIRETDWRVRGKDPVWIDFSRSPNK